MYLMKSQIARSLFPLKNGIFLAGARFSSSSSTDNNPPAEGGSCGTKKSSPLKRATTPIGKLDEYEEGQHPFQEKEPLQPWPQSTNPHTGEVGGPKGPEPTRYGDWERKGRVTDF